MNKRTGQVMIRGPMFERGESRGGRSVAFVWV